MNDFSATDRAHMRRALELAARGLNTTTPNPAVGCVIANGDAVIAEAFHERAGEAHAEARALAHAGERARGATVYVTLEPCTVDGRTPPCVDALISAGVSKVVYALDDPNPAVNGAGRRALEAAGIAVSAGLLADVSETLNEGYVSRQRRGRPFVTMKWAQSLDGATAMASGESQWITGAAARADAQNLRARSCAIMTGIGTVLEDDPMLTARGAEVSRQPLRIVLDSQCRMPTAARMLDSESAVLVVSTVACKNSELLKRAQHWQLPADDTGRVVLAELMSRLGEAGINELMLEAGATLGGSMLAAGLVDRMVAYVAPALLGSNTRGVLETPAWRSLADGWQGQIENVQMVGDDLRVQMIRRNRTQ